MGGKADRSQVVGHIGRIHVRILLLVLNCIELRWSHLGVPLHDPMLLSNHLPLDHGRLRLLLVHLLLKSLLLPRHEMRVVRN